MMTPFRGIWQKSTFVYCTSNVDFCQITASNFQTKTTQILPLSGFRKHRSTWHLPFCTGFRKLKLMPKLLFFRNISDYHSKVRSWKWKLSQHHKNNWFVWSWMIVNSFGRCTGHIGYCAIVFWTVWQLSITLVPDISTVHCDTRVRPPGTLVRKAFCFSRDVYLFFFNQTQDLRAPSADRHETLPRDHYLLRLDNPGPKFQGALP